MEIDYVKLTADELARDPLFRKWILQPSSSVNHFWQSFLLLHPAQKQKTQHARELLMLAYGFSDTQLDPLRKDKIHRQLIARIDQSRNRKIRARVLFSIAAVSLFLMIILASSMIGDHPSENGLVYTAGFGERQKIVLPDGSAVDLNANSNLRLGNGWDQGIQGGLARRRSIF